MKKKGIVMLAGVMAVSTILGTSTVNAQGKTEKLAVNIPDAGIAMVLNNYDIDDYLAKAELTDLINEKVMLAQETESSETSKTKQETKKEEKTTEDKAKEEEKKPEEETPKKEEETTKQEPEKEKSVYDTIAMTKVEDYVNVRQSPNTESEIVGKIYNNCAATILGTEGDWYKVVSGNVTGYIKSSYFVTGEEAKKIAIECGYVNATVKTETLNVRESQGTDSPILTQLPEDGVFDVIEYGDGWVYLNVDEDVRGWVSMDFVDIRVSFNTAITLEEEQARIEEEERKKREAEEAERKAREAREEQERRAAEEAEIQRQAQALAREEMEEGSNSQSYTESQPVVVSQTYDTSSSAATREAVVAYAMQFVGNPYVYGGSSLTNGTDCSGFTMRVYEHFGYSLPHQSGSQSGYGTRVSTDSLLPGDLLFYSSGGSGIGHVAIYIGDGQVVHASTERTGIKVSNAFYRSPICATRLIQ